MPVHLYLIQVVLTSKDTGLIPCVCTAETRDQCYKLPQRAKVQPINAIHWTAVVCISARLVSGCPTGRPSTIDSRLRCFRRLLFVSRQNPSDRPPKATTHLFHRRGLESSQLALSLSLENAQESWTPLLYKLLNQVSAILQTQQALGPLLFLSIEAGLHLFF